MNEDALINGRKKFFFTNPSWYSKQADVEDGAGEKLFCAVRQENSLQNTSAAIWGLVGGGAIAILCLGVFGLTLNSRLAAFILAILFGLAFYFWIALSQYKPRHFYIYDYETKSKLLLEIREMDKVGFPKAHFGIYRKGLTIGLAESGQLVGGWRFKNPDGSLLCTTKRVPAYETVGFWGALTKQGRPQIAVYDGQPHGTQLGVFLIKRNWADRTMLDLSIDSSHTIDPWIILGIGVLMNYFSGHENHVDSSGGGE
ncbi:MAG: hypothetical protein AAF490_14385 [Chloroflexota bacterium]